MSKKVIAQKVASVLDNLPVDYQIDNDRIKINDGKRIYRIGLNFILSKMNNLTDYFVDLFGYNLDDLKFFVAAGMEPLSEPFEIEGRIYTWNDKIPVVEDCFGDLEFDCGYVMA